MKKKLTFLEVFHFTKKKYDKQELFYEYLIVKVIWGHQSGSSMILLFF